VGRFRCLKCGLVFHREQIPGTDWSRVTCPGCGHLYIEWENYGEFALKAPSRPSEPVSPQTLSPGNPLGENDGEG